MNIPKVRRHADTIAALAATEYKFILAKQSVLAAAALAAAVKGLVKEQTETEHVIIKLAARLKCSCSEIEYFMFHMESLLISCSSSSKETSSIPISQTALKCSRSGSQTPTDLQEMVETVFV